MFIFRLLCLWFTVLLFLGVRKFSEFSLCRKLLQVSVDSGKASSVGGTPSATSPSMLPDVSVFEFDFPTEYCGRLIGRNGKNINQIKHKTGAEISLKRKQFTRDYQICSVEGAC